MATCRAQPRSSLLWCPVGCRQTELGGLLHLVRSGQVPFLALDLLGELVSHGGLYPQARGPAIPWYGSLRAYVAPPAPPLATHLVPHEDGLLGRMPLRRYHRPLQRTVRSCHSCHSWLMSICVLSRARARSSASGPAWRSTVGECGPKPVRRRRRITTAPALRAPGRAATSPPPPAPLGLQHLHALALHDSRCDSVPSLWCSNRMHFTPATPK